MWGYSFTAFVIKSINLLTATLSTRTVLASWRLDTVLSMDQSLTIFLEDLGATDAQISIPLIAATLTDAWPITRPTPIRPH
jgi:hypothetical protein